MSKCLFVKEDVWKLGRKNRSGTFKHNQIFHIESNSYICYLLTFNMKNLSASKCEIDFVKKVMPFLKISYLCKPAFSSLYLQGFSHLPPRAFYKIDLNSCAYSFLCVKLEI